MPNVWVVRAEFGKFTNHFISKGFVGIGWLPDDDLTQVASREEIRTLYTARYPKDKSNVVIGQQVGQIARFALEMQTGDYVITPAAQNERLHYGVVSPGSSYFHHEGDDGCHYRHRRRVNWDDTTVARSDFSVPFQNTIRSALTIFSVSQIEEFFTSIGRHDLVTQKQLPDADPNRVVLDQVLELDATEFELLVGHLLTALGFEEAEVTGKPGDQGVDATGVLNASNLARIRVFVQAKRYKDRNVSSAAVRSLRQSIPVNGQGAVITTSDFHKGAHEVANEIGFPRIGLINGTQLVDLLIEHWQEIPKEFQDLLDLKPGLVKA